MTISTLVKACGKTTRVSRLRDPDDGAVHTVTACDARADTVELDGAR